MASGLRMSQEQYAELLRKRAAQAPAEVTTVSAPIAKPAEPATGLSAEDARLLKGAKAKQKFHALGRIAKSDMNKTEEAFAALLNEWERAGKVLWWKFHIIKVRLADGAWYETDFLVMHQDRSLWIYETKGGFTTEKGQLKIRACAEVLPVIGIIKAIKRKSKDGGGFELKDFSK